MRSALRNAWPEMVKQLGSAGVFERIENSIAECERVLKEFLKEISPDASKQNNDAQIEPLSNMRSLEGLFLSTDFHAYIDAVRRHELEFV
jgi:hypothetical protein